MRKKSEYLNKRFVTNRTGFYFNAGKKHETWFVRPPLLPASGVIDTVTREVVVIPAAVSFDKIKQMYREHLITDQ